MRKLVLGMLAGVVCLLGAGIAGCGEDGAIAELIELSRQGELVQSAQDQTQTAHKTDGLIWSTQEARSGSAVTAEGLSAMAGAQEATGDQPANQDNWLLQTMPEVGAPLVPVFIDNSARIADAPKNEMVNEVVTAAQQMAAAAKKAESILPEGVEIPELEIDEGVPTAFDTKKTDVPAQDTFENQSITDAQAISRQLKQQVESFPLKDGAVDAAIANNTDEIPVPGIEVFETGGVDIALPEMSVAQKPQEALQAAVVEAVMENGANSAEILDEQAIQREVSLIAQKLAEVAAGADRRTDDRASMAAADKLVADTDELESFLNEISIPAVPVAAEEKAGAVAAQVEINLDALALPELGEEVSKESGDWRELMLADDTKQEAIAEDAWGEVAAPAAAGEETAVEAAGNGEAAETAEEEKDAEVAADKPAAEETALEEGAEVQPEATTVGGEAQDEPSIDEMSPAVETKTSEAPADSSAARLIQLEKIRQEARMVEARKHFNTGMDFFNAGQYQAATDEFDKAVRIDPDFADARSFRERTRQMLGRTDGVEDDKQLMDEITRNRAARLRERELRINNSLGKAETYYISAINPDEIRKTMSRIEQIKAGMDDLEQAQQEVQAAETLLQGAGLPKSVEKTLQMRVMALKAQVSDSRRSMNEERAMIDRREAQQKALESRQDSKAQQVREIEQLFAGVDYYYKRTEYDMALELLEKIRALDPTNPKVTELRGAIRRAYLQDLSVETDSELKNSEDSWSSDVIEAKVMPKDMLIYPLDWERVKQRARIQSQGGVVDFERQRILNALAAVTGSVEYAELPLNMVLDDFRRRARVNIMLGQDVDREMPITISLRDVSLLTAFETLLSAYNLEYTVKDQALEVFEKGTGGSSEVILKILQVADLTTPKRNFYPRRITSDTISAGGWGDDDDDDEEDEWQVTPENLQEQIREFVPGDWDNEQYSVELWEDNLLVKATPEMIAKVTKYLEGLRRSSKIQVFVEGRFMSITDDFKEMIGFDWTSSYSNSQQGASKQLQGGLRITPTTPPSTFMNAAGRVSGAETTLEGLWSQNPVNYLLDSLHMKLVINAAQNTKKGSVLHNPKVLVANGHNAYARVITTTPFMTNYTTAGVYVLPVMTELPQGVTWETRPIVSFDRKYITVRVRPKVEEFDRTYEDVLDGPISIAMNEADSDFIYGYSFRIYNPVTKVVEFETNATLPDGGTILVGGMMQDRSSEKLTGIPIMSSLPYAGRLFRTTYENRAGINRVIMISAKIVQLDD